MAGCALLLAAGLCAAPPHIQVYVQPVERVREVCNTLETGKFWCHTWSLDTSGTRWSCDIRIPLDVLPWDVWPLEEAERALCAQWDGHPALVDTP